MGPHREKLTKGLESNIVLNCVPLGEEWKFIIEFSYQLKKIHIYVFFTFVKHVFFFFFPSFLDQSYHLDQKTEQLELQPKIRYVQEDSIIFKRRHFKSKISETYKNMKYLSLSVF